MNPWDDAAPRLSDRRRALVERSLYAFIDWSWPIVDPATFVPNWHVGLICDYLEACTVGEIRKLVINIPPGYQKSLTVCVFWHAWTWILHPDHTWMFTSYKGDLALRDADRARALITSREYQREFGDRYQLRGGQNVKSRYANDRGGYRFSTGISGIMGEGGRHVVLDDPHNVEQAESDNVRDETVRKIKLALPSRNRDPNGSRVVIMQRLHTRDFAGEALKEKGWHHLCLPARYEYDHPTPTRPITLPSGRALAGDRREDPAVMDRFLALKALGRDDEAKQFASEHNGELLNPVLFPEARVAELEEPMGTYGAAGQLQQRPVPREGGVFSRKWLTENTIPESELPRGRVVVRGWDFAGSVRKTSPYTVGARLSVHRGTYYIEHVVRERKTPAGVEDLLRETARLDGRHVTIDIPQDPGQSGKGQVRSFAILLAGYVVRSSPESGSKEARFDPFAAQAEAGNVRMVEGVWNGALLDELGELWTGDYKDQADAISRAFARLLQLGGRMSVGGHTGAA